MKRIIGFVPSTLSCIRSSTFFVFVSLAALIAMLGRAQIAAVQQASAAEIWTLKGYALGKTAGNETGDVCMADVIRLDNGTYRMYYGYKASPSLNPSTGAASVQTPSGVSIKYAESTDGITWTAKAIVLQGGTVTTDREYDVSGPSVLKLPDGRYRMYYQSTPQSTGQGMPKHHVRSAISSDGVNFTREGVRIEISSVDANSPLQLAGHGTYYIASDGTYVGIFSGNFTVDGGQPSALVMATSSDGLSFPYANIRKVYPIGWHDPIVIKVSGGYRMYATYLRERQGTAFSADGLNWPAEMTQVTFQDASGTVLTEDNPGIGDFGGMLLPSGAIRLFANYGTPSQAIVYFEMSSSTTSIPTTTSSASTTTIPATTTSSSSTTIRTTTTSISSTTIPATTVPGSTTTIPATEVWTLKGYALGKTAGNESNQMVAMSEVIRLDNGTYRMYYGYTAAAGSQQTPSGSSIKYAESTDGITWTPKAIVLQGGTVTTDREYLVSGPSVLKLPDGRYRMYYQSGPQSASREVPKFHVRSAISSDGVNFTREGVRIEISSVDSNSPVYFAGHGSYYIASDGTYVGIFCAHFNNEMGPSPLAIATSSDGLSFPYANIKKLYDIWHDPIVIKVSGGYRMYASYLLEKQGTALSADGLSWPAEMTEVRFQDASGNRLTEENPGIGDYGGVLLPSGAIRLFSNYGNPSQDIVYFETSSSTTSIPTTTSSSSTTTIPTTTTSSSSTTIRSTTTSSSSTTIRSTTTSSSSTTIPATTIPGSSTTISSTTIPGSSSTISATTISGSSTTIAATSTTIPGLPGKAKLLSPSGTIATNLPIYTWNAVPNSTWYYLWVNDASQEKKILQWYAAEAAGCALGTGVCSVTPATLLATGAAQWWIQTWNTVGYGPWSDGLTFNVAASTITSTTSTTIPGTSTTIPGPPAKATLIAPSGTIATNLPTYSWNAVPNSTWYYLWVNDASQEKKILQWYTAEAAGCALGTGVCSVTPTTPLLTGAAQWWIRTWNTIGDGPWSDGLSFNVVASTTTSTTSTTIPGPPGKATLIAPSGTIATNLPTYSWNAVTNSTWYCLWVNDAPQEKKILQWYTAEAAGCALGTGVCSVTPDTPLATGAAQWWIQTWNTIGDGPWSDGLRFNVGTVGSPGKASAFRQHVSHRARAAAATK